MSATLTPWRPYGMMDPFQKEMETLFTRFFGGENEGGQMLQAAKAWAPRVDVEETEKEFIVKADLPGVDPKAVEISVENGILTVRGEKKEEKEKKEKNFHRMERFIGSFYRAIALPPGVDPEKVNATSANGVVTIVVPKKPEMQPKKISVMPKS